MTAHSVPAEQDGTGIASNNPTTPNGTTPSTFPELSQDSTTSTTSISNIIINNNNHFIPESPSYSEFSDATDFLPKSIDTVAHDTIFQGLTEEEVLQIDELGDDGMIDRYIRACGGDMQLALRRIKDTLAWLRVEKPREMVCTACLEKDPTSHYMHVVGHDIQKRPVIYSCLALATNRNVEDNKVHMLSTFENAILLMPRAADAEGGDEGDGPSSATTCSWVWIMDMHGFGFKDCSPQLARIFLNLSAAHYPERLGQFLIVGAPSIFSTLWKAVHPFIDVNTRKKIHFRNYDYKPHKGKKEGKLKPLLEEYFDQDMVDWLLEEMRENRDKERVVMKRKHYDYRALANVVVGGMEHDEVMREADARRRGSLTGSHDNLGTEAYLKMIGGETERMLPGLLKLSTLLSLDEAGLE